MKTEAMEPRALASTPGADSAPLYPHSRIDLAPLADGRRAAGQPPLEASNQSGQKRRLDEGSDGDRPFNERGECGEDLRAEVKRLKSILAVKDGQIEMLQNMVQTAYSSGKGSRS